MTTRLTDYLVPLGRVLFGAIFLISAPGHFTQQAIGYSAQQGVPLPQVLVPFSGVLMVAGALSIMVGYRAAWGGWALVTFLVPVTILMHNFWAVTDPMMSQMQRGMFLKNVSMLGGALFIAHFGAGPVSLDAWRERRRAAAGADQPVTRDWPARTPTTADPR